MGKKKDKKKIRKILIRRLENMEKQSNGNGWHCPGEIVKVAKEIRKYCR